MCARKLTAEEAKKLFKEIKPIDLRHLLAKHNTSAFDVDMYVAGRHRAPAAQVVAEWAAEWIADADAATIERLTAKKILEPAPPPAARRRDPLDRLLSRPIAAPRGADCAERGGPDRDSESGEERDWLPIRDPAARQKAKKTKAARVAAPRAPARPPPVRPAEPPARPAPARPAEPPAEPPARPLPARPAGLPTWDAGAWSAGPPAEQHRARPAAPPAEPTAAPQRTQRVASRSVLDITPGFADWLGATAPAAPVADLDAPPSYEEVMREKERERRAAGN